jgi:hypothetical protein
LWTLNEKEDYFYQKKLGNLFEEYIAPNLQKIEVSKSSCLKA